MERLGTATSHFAKSHCILALHAITPRDWPAGHGLRPLSHEASA